MILFCSNFTCWAQTSPTHENNWKHALQVYDIRMFRIFLIEFPDAFAMYIYIYIICISLVSYVCVCALQCHRLWHSMRHSIATYIPESSPSCKSTNAETSSNWQIDNARLRFQQGHCLVCAIVSQPPACNRLLHCSHSQARPAIEIPEC